MPEFHFSQTETDVVAIGSDLSVETLLRAYRHGVFPWPEDEVSPILWCCPRWRGILRHEALHLPRSLRKSGRQNAFSFSVNRCFETVIRQCATVVRANQPGTWITRPMQDAYIELHHRGWAHSIETWQNDRLVGGLYGVLVNGVFSGESMFCLAPDASKWALITLMQLLHRMGIQWIDTQMLTPVVISLGGERVSRETYLKMIRGISDNSAKKNRHQFDSI